MAPNCELRAKRRGRQVLSRTGLRVSLGVVLAGVVFGLMGLTAYAAKARTEKFPTVSYHPQKSFTIKEILPNPEKEEVRIVFSAPVPLELVRGNLHFLPRIKLDWDSSTMTPQGVLTLKGNFRYGAPHYINLPEALEVRGKTYVPTLTKFTMPDRLVRVEFVEDKRVIERDSGQFLHVRTVNVQQVFLESVRVPPVLLPQGLAAERAKQDLGQVLSQLKTARAELEPLLKGNRAYHPFAGQPLQENQLFPAGGEKNQLKAVSLPLSFRRNKERGALELIRVKDQREGSPAATEPRLFRLTDLGLTYKLGQQQALLWVNSLNAGTPLSGVQVLAFTRQLEVFLLGVTGTDGVLRISPEEREGLSLKRLGAFTTVKRRVDIKDFTFLMAGTDGDVSFIEVLPEGNVKPKDIRQVSGPEAPRNLKGQVFTERGVYRPGEKVFFKGAVREYNNGAIESPQGLPVRFTVTNSKGEQVFRSEAQLSDFGTAAGEMATEPHWPVGAYTLAMHFGPDSPAEAETPPPEEEEPEYDDEGRRIIKPRTEGANVTFQVQEFKAPRHFTEIAFERFTRPDRRFVNRERQAEYVRIVMSSAYYVGGAVKHGQVRWKIHQSRTDYQVPGYEGYTFGCDGKEQGDLIESGQAVLDEKGRNIVEFPLDRNLVSGRQGLWVTATVVDFDGRAASGAKRFQADPDFLVGISRHPDKIQMEEPQDLKLVVLDRQGKRAGQGDLKVEVLQRSWTYVAKRNDQGDLYWDDATIWKKTLATDVPLKRGEGAFRFDCAEGGRYLLAFSFTDGKGRTFMSSTPFRVAWEYRMEEKRDRPFEPLGLWADRPAYKPGDTANITLSPRGPVSSYLVTVERDGVLTYQVVRAGQETKTLPVPIKGDYAPNVYVSVLGLSPRGDFPVHAGRYDAEAPGFVWGTLNLAVLKEPEGLEVKISPAKPELKAEPGAPATLDLLVADLKGKGVEAEIAVAVVDESVLALTGFKTPALDRLTRFDLPLRVFTGELRPALIHQTPFYPSRIEPLTGGGGMSGEMLSKLRKRFQAVAYFNPAVRTDAQGKAQVSFTLPDNIASYRAYAVAADRGGRFANAERQFVSAKDFYLEPGLPNYFIRGDSFRFQVAAFNTGQATGPMHFSLAVQGGLTVSAEDKVQLEPKGSARLKVSGAAAATGPAILRFAGQFLDKRDEVELTLKINSGLVRDTTSVFSSFTGACEAKLTLPPYLAKAGADQVNLDEIQAVLTLSGSPFARLTRPIRYLLQYPYGCVEQTSSGVLGLAALRGLIQDGHISGVGTEEVDRFLKVGIDRLFTMQTAEGEFVYWPGHRYAHSWGTIYAVAALSVAKGQGIPIWEEGLGKSLKELGTSVRHREIPPVRRAFVCYLLAMNKALDRDVYGRVKQDEARMTREGKLLLLLAAEQAGLQSPGELKSALKSLLEAKEETGARSWEEEFNALYRGPALELLAAQRIMPDDPATGRAAQKLLAGLGKDGLWTSTSDTGWALLALGEHFKGVAFGEETGEVKVTLPQGATQTFTLDPRMSRSLILDAGAFLKNPTVKLKGRTGRAWLYQVDFTAPRLDLADKGVEQGFKVTKVVKNTDGGDLIKVGDLVKVSLLVDVARNQRYVVIDDPLPAGLMAVNTAFTTEETIPPGREGEEEDFFDYFAPDGTIRFRPNFFEIRDDRVLAFRDLVYAGSYRFEYYARAVCEGSFVMPSTQAAAMYSPGEKGLSPQGGLTVQAR